MARRYFAVTVGLRGGYMPDDSYCISVTTRKRLAEFLVEAAEPWDDLEECDEGADFYSEHGGLAGAAAIVAGDVWARSPSGRDGWLETMLPLPPNGAMGIGLTPIGRFDAEDGVIDL